MATCVLLIVMLGARYHATTEPGRLDDLIDVSLPGALGAHGRLLSAVADLVPGFVTVMAVLLAGFFGRFHRWHTAAFAVLAPALTILITEGLKHLVDRTIHGGLAYPSGHTSGATSILLVLALLALRRAPARPWVAAASLLIAVTAGAAAVGLTMVSIHAHYPTDTVAGYCTAIVVTLGLAMGLDARRTRTQPGRTSSGTSPR